MSTGIFSKNLFNLFFMNNVVEEISQLQIAAETETEIAQRSIAIIGLGYVGLPLAIEFGKHYNVMGFDINQERIAELSEGNDRTKEADMEELLEAMRLKEKSGKSRKGLSFSFNREELREYNTFIVTVPTPI